MNQPVSFPFLHPLPLITARGPGCAIAPQWVRADSGRRTHFLCNSQSKICKSVKKFHPRAQVASVARKCSGFCCPDVPIFTVTGNLLFLNFFRLELGDPALGASWILPTLPNPSLRHCLQCFYENRCSLTGRNKSKMKIQQISVNFSLNHYLIVHVNVNVIISFTRQTNCHQALRVILTLFPLSTRTHRHTDTHTPNRLLCADH